MKKKIFIFAVLMTVIINCTPAFAQDYLFSAYGSKSFENNFDITTTSQLSGYPYYISGGATLTISDSVSRSGKSVEINVQDLALNATEKILLSFHPTASTTKPVEEDYYVEAYIKGYTDEPDNLVPYYEYNAGNTVISDYGMEAVEDGWYRLWFTVPMIYDYVIDGHIGWIYTQQANEPSTIWLDDFSMRPIPHELILEKRSCSNAQDFDLSTIPAYGYSPNGTRHNIENRKLIKWSVLSGDAYVENGMLKFRTQATQEIELEADFFGVKAKTSVWAYDYELDDNNKSIYATVEKSENQYNAIIRNNTDEDTTVYLIVATYRNNMLYKVNKQKQSLSAMTTINMVCPIADVPQILGGEVTSSVYVWTGEFGMNKIPVKFNK